MNLLKVLMFGLLSTMILSCASTKNSQSRDEKKAVRQIENTIAFNKALKALESRDFVVKVNRVTFRLGQFEHTSPSTNFVSLSGKDATVQLAFDHVGAGPNAIGGITVKGKASNIKESVDKHGNVSFKMSIIGHSISASVIIKLYKDSNACEVEVSPNLNNNRLTLKGYLFPNAESGVFEGRSL